MARVRPKQWAAACGGVVVTACLGACSDPAALPASTGAAPRAIPSADASPAPAERLSAGLARMPQQRKGNRNPFQFRTRPQAEPSRPASEPDPASYPELPLPQPAIRVLGVATDPDPAGGPPKRTAILTVGGDLVLAAERTLVAGRYRVTAIGEREVELVDQVDHHVERLALR